MAVAKQKGIKHIVLVSSIGVDDLFFPLNLFFGVRFPSSHIYLCRICQDTSISCSLAVMICSAGHLDKSVARVQSQSWQGSKDIALSS